MRVLESDVKHSSRVCTFREAPVRFRCCLTRGQLSTEAVPGSVSVSHYEASSPQRLSLGEFPSVTMRSAEAVPGRESFRQSL